MTLSDFLSLADFDHRGCPSCYEFVEPRVGSCNQLQERRVVPARKFSIPTNDQLHLNSAPTHLHGNHSDQREVSSAWAIRFSAGSRGNLMESRIPSAFRSTRS